MSDDAPEHLVWVIPERLSDGSTAYNVHVYEAVLAAASEDDAHELAQKIVDAINEHSCTTAGVMEG